MTHSRDQELISVAASTESAPKPILVCYGGSAESDRALTAALTLFGRHDVVVATAWQSLQTQLAENGAPAATIEGGPGNSGDVHERVAAEELLLAAAALARTAGHRVIERSEQAQGPVWMALLEVADEVDAAVIVTGSHGRGALASAVLGSVSRELVAYSRRPVMVVPNRL